MTKFKGVLKCKNMLRKSTFYYPSSNSTLKIYLNENNDQMDSIVYLKSPFEHNLFSVSSSSLFFLRQPKTRQNQASVNHNYFSSKMHTAKSQKAASKWCLSWPYD